MMARKACRCMNLPTRSTRLASEQACTDDESRHLDRGSRRAPRGAEMSPSQANRPMPTARHERKPLLLTMKPSAQRRRPVRSWTKEKGWALLGLACQWECDGAHREVRVAQRGTRDLGLYLICVEGCPQRCSVEAAPRDSASAGMPTTYIPKLPSMARDSARPPPASTSEWSLSYHMFIHVIRRDMPTGARDSQA